MCEEYKNILIKYLTNAGIYCGNGNWDIIEDSQFGGRCLMANKDFELNEVIFCDKPLFYGPRGSNYEKVSDAFENKYNNYFKFYSFKLYFLKDILYFLL